MKRLIIASSFMLSVGLSQGDIYPVETSYGGGIGFGNMYLIMSQVPGGEVLDSLGFDADELDTRPMVFYGGEGFAQMTGPWRLGGYAGIGSAQVSNVYNVVLFANRDGVDQYQPPAANAGNQGDQLYNFTDNLNHDILGSQSWAEFMLWFKPKPAHKTGIISLFHLYHL